MKEFNLKKLKWLLRIAHEVKTASKDESTQIGGVIFDENYTILSTGYNSFPRGIKDGFAYRQERPEKYFWMEHAERNAIYNAIRAHADIRNSNMILTCGIPCADCARGIIQASIKNLICQKGVGTAVTGEGAKLKWNESCDRAHTMLTEAGVNLHYVEDLFENLLTS
jgi:dCMP deaminase